MLAAGAAVPA